MLPVLLARAEREDGALVARASTRDIAEQLEFLSKDTVHRRLRQLVRAGVITHWRTSSRMLTSVPAPTKGLVSVTIS